MLENPVSSGVIVMGNPKWRPGILGLVANKLAEAHGKPVFLWGREGGEAIRGSSRAGDGVSVVDMMAGASDAFEHFGGHHASGGFAVKEEKVHELMKRLEESHETLKRKGVPPEVVVLERSLPLRETKHAMRDLAKMSPFGVGNPKPLFLFEGVRAARVKMFGKQGDHLDVSFEQDNEFVSGISFFHSPEGFNKPIMPGEKMDVVGHIELDWRGSPRIRIVDVI
jgi:single-stranded-DNA-specific exonuclease